MMPKARLMNLSIAFTVVLGVAVCAADEKTFQAGPAESYSHQTAEKVTIGAKPFDTDNLTASAFCKKADLLKYGVLPVLVVVKVLLVAST